MGDATYQKILNKVMLLLSYRPRTRKELTQRLGKYLKSEKPLSDEEKKTVAHQVLDYLDQNKLINDEEFAKLFIESKSKGKSVLGKRAILAKLMEKGISKSDAGMYLDATVSEEDELTTANKALIRRFKIVAFAGPAPAKALQPELYSSPETQDSMAKYLVGRGFSYDIARQAVDYLLKRP